MPIFVPQSRRLLRARLPKEQNRLLLERKSYEPFVCENYRWHGTTHGIPKMSSNVSMCASATDCMLNPSFTVARACFPKSRVLSSSE